MSMLDIALKQADYAIVITSLGTGTTNLIPSTAEVPEITCRAETMIKYRKKLSELEALLEQYKALLEKDKAALLSVMSNMVQMDAVLAGRFGH